MIAVAPPMIVVGILLLFNAVALWAMDHPFLVFFDIVLAAYVLWNSIDRIDPPAGGGGSYDAERHSSLYSGA